MIWLIIVFAVGEVFVLAYVAIKTERRKTWSKGIDFNLRVIAFNLVIAMVFVFLTLIKHCK